MLEYQIFSCIELNIRHTKYQTQNVFFLYSVNVSQLCYNTYTDKWNISKYSLYTTVINYQFK